MSPILVPPELFIALAVVAGVSLGYLLREKLAGDERLSWMRERADLVRRVQSASPGEYVAATAAEKAVEEAPPPAPVPPWSKDPSMSGIEVVLSPTEGRVYFTQGEDCWDEDLKPFMESYGLDPRDASKWGGA